MEKAQRQEMMQFMIEQFFGRMVIEEKKEMCSEMMRKLTEGLDMKEMMPKIMMGMMSGGAGGSPEKMHEIMVDKIQGALSIKCHRCPK